MVIQACLTKESFTSDLLEDNIAPDDVGRRRSARGANRR
jgi:hypothetical protein